MVYILHLEKCLIASPRLMVYSKHDNKVGLPLTFTYNVLG